jgi:cbb3-type cytochrome oxidase subunit 3
MKPAPIPRALIIISIALVAVTFLAGVLHAFDTARAASSKPTATASLQANNDSELTPTPVSTPVSVSGDTTGIIALAIVIVIIVLVGATMGAQRPHKKKTP